MREYSYKDKWQKLLTPEIVQLLTRIHEFKGEQRKFVAIHADKLTELVEIAKIQSTGASNRIEGIFTSNERLKKIVLEKTNPRARSELEIAGYRDVLNMIHESYEHIPIKPTVILQLHRDLYKYGSQEAGGHYKNADNVIAEVDVKGNKKTRFEPVPTWETAPSVDLLCQAYAEIINEKTVDILLIIPMFILDFLCIHPFNDGNGRMSRLLTLLLLYRADYSVGKYISIEKLIEISKDVYYEALQTSSLNWHEGENTYEPFVKYMFEIIVSAYRELSNRIDLIANDALSKPDRVSKIIEETVGTITKTEIVRKCPDISQITVQRALAELLENEKIVKIGGGRYTKYKWNREEKQK
jgi:Fic family protein